MKPRARLFRKYFAPILALVCGALVASGATAVYFSYQENKAALAALQEEKALTAATHIEQFVRRVEQQLAFAAPQLDGAPLDQRRLELIKLQHFAKDVTDVAEVDADGRERLFESRLAVSVAQSGKDWSGEPAFRNARPGQSWFGPVYFRKETEPYMSVGVRAGRDKGPLIVADVNLKFMWDVVTRIKVGQKGKAYVVDGNGYLIADPDIGLVLRKTDLSGLAQVRAALRDDAAERAMVAADPAGRRVLTAWAPVEPLGWKVFVEQPASEVFQALDAIILRNLALLLAGLAFSAAAAAWLARGMARPIRVLQEGAQRIGAGELGQRIELHTGDELEGLAEQFNRMSAQLRESYAGLERKVEERTLQLRQALEQQTATSEVLRVISGSPTDVQPVFDAIVNSCFSLFKVGRVTLWLRAGEELEVRARVSARTEKPGAYSRTPLDRDSGVGRCVLEARLIHLPDMREVTNELPRARQLGLSLDYRAALFAPLRREDRAIGALSLLRPEPGPFDDKEIALLQTFADQAVIAIENVRLFNETKEALEQQTASGEVLGAISSSIADTAPVFDKIVESCERLFAGYLVGVNLVEADGAVHLRAYRGAKREEMLRIYPLPLSADSGTGLAILERRVVHFQDVAGAANLPPGVERGAAVLGFRSIVFAPMLFEGQGIGAIWVAREFPGAFTDKQMALLKTFADQAVIAIQNARLFREIEEKSRQLEIANKHKSEFLANMSHELRTPLNAIIGFSEVLMDRMFGEVNAKQADYLKDIHESGRHLLSLINDILDLSKIEAGRMDLEVSSFDLPAAISNAMTLVRERAQRHGIRLGLEVDKRLGEFQADERKFKQIVLNLLSNAVKFTPDGGRVDVRAKLDTAKVEIAVEDTGIGIAPEDQRLVFEEFKQVGRDYTRKAEGTGLGLALTKKFVELHGGEIHLRSAPGKGSTFIFTLPVRA